MDSPSLSLSAEYRTKLCFFLKKKSHQPKCGSQWWVIIISLVCFQWSLPAKIRRQTGAGWGVTKGFDLNQGIFFPHYLNWKHLVEFLFLSFFLFFFFFLWFDCYQFNYQDTLWASKQTHPKNLHVLLRTQTRVRAGGSSGEGHKCSRRASCNTDFLLALRTFVEGKILEASNLLSQSTWLWLWPSPWSSGVFQCKNSHQKRHLLRLSQRNM